MKKLICKIFGHKWFVFITGAKACKRCRIRTSGAFIKQMRAKF